MKSFRQGLAAAALAAALAGCAVGPDFHEPDPKMPASFADVPAAKTQPSVDLVHWWQSFGDSELSALVERAAKENPTVDIALNRLQEARTAETVVMGYALPAVDVSGAYGRGTGSDLTRERAGGPLHSADTTSGYKQITQAIGFDAGWEIDLFGKFRREQEAAGYDEQAARAARNAVLVTIIADVAHEYMDLRGLQARLGIARQSVAAEQHTYDLVKTRYDLGLTNELDVRLAERELATLKAGVAPFESGVNAAEYAIATLLGAYPQTLVPELDTKSAVPSLPGTIDLGAPVDLLRRRPDIVEAEWQLAGATARIGVATANLFPAVEITGGIGFQGGDVSAAAAAKSFIWSAGPSVSWSVLDFGALDALRDIADHLRTREMLSNYKQTVLGAVQQVDTDWGDYKALQSRLADLGTALAASRNAVELASERYDRGLTDFLNVLDAEREAFTLQDENALAEEAAADSLVSLYKALGGGWEAYQQVPAIRAPQPAILAAAREAVAPTELTATP